MPFLSQQAGRLPSGNGRCPAPVQRFTGLWLLATFIGLLFVTASPSPALSEVLLSDPSAKIFGTGPRATRDCTLQLEPTLTRGEELAPRLVLMISGAGRLSFGVDKPSQYSGLVIVQNNSRQPLSDGSNATIEQFRLSNMYKALRSERPFFATAQLPGGKFVSSRYEGVKFDEILAKVEALCPFDAESLMTNQSLRAKAEEALRISSSDLTLIRWALGNKYGGATNKPDQTSSLSALERGYLKRYAGDNGLPISQYLTSDSARRLITDGQSLANLASPTSSPTPPTVVPARASSPPPPVAKPDFHSYDNIDFDGDDIKPWRMNYTFGECQTACMENGSCRAFTFNKRRNVCILKTGTGRLKPSVEAISASLEPVSVPRANITIQNGIDLPGGDLNPNGIRNISVEQCASACLGNGSCAGFSYVKSKQWCWMKQAVLGRRLNEDIVSGVK